MVKGLYMFCYVQFKILLMIKWKKKKLQKKKTKKA